MKKELLVGIFFFGGLALLLFLTLRVEAAKGLFFHTEEHSHRVRFDTARHMRVGDPGFVGEHRAGRITGLEVVAEDGRRRVEFEFVVLAPMRVHGDSRATIWTNPLLGNSRLEVTLGSSQANPLPDGALVASDDPPADLSRLIAQANEVAEEIRPAIKNINAIISNVKAGEGVAGKFLMDKEMGETVAEIISELRTAAGSLNEQKGTLGLLLNDPQVYNELRELLRKARMAVEDAREQAPISSFSTMIFSAIQ